MIRPGQLLVGQHVRAVPERRGGIQRYRREGQHRTERRAGHPDHEQQQEAERAGEPVAVRREHGGPQRPGDGEERECSAAWNAGWSTASMWRGRCHSQTTAVNTVAPMCAVGRPAQPPAAGCALNRLQLPAHRCGSARLIGSVAPPAASSGAATTSSSMCWVMWPVSERLGELVHRSCRCCGHRRQPGGEQQGPRDNANDVACHGAATDSCRPRAVEPAENAQRHDGGEQPPRRLARCRRGRGDDAGPGHSQLRHAGNTISAMPSKTMIAVNNRLAANPTPATRWARPLWAWCRHRRGRSRATSTTRASVASRSPPVGSPWRGTTTNLRFNVPMRPMPRQTGRLGDAPCGGEVQRPRHRTPDGAEPHPQCGDQRLTRLCLLLGLGSGWAITAVPER